MSLICVESKGIADQIGTLHIELIKNIIYLTSFCVNKYTDGLQKAQY